MIMAPDLAASAGDVLDQVAAWGAPRLVISGYPPGIDVLAREAASRGVAVRVLFHSSMAQHGDVASEAAVVDEAYGLLRDGLLDAIGFTKEGLAEAFTALGMPAMYVPPATANPGPADKLELPGGPHLGIFGEATGRKNVTTQVGAAALLGATPHVTALPAGYLAGRVTVHSIVERSQYLGLLASMDLNLNVSLYECFPVTPQESFHLGVPCLVSRTSALFRDDPFLWDLLTVSEHDNPAAIAGACRRILAVNEKEGLIGRAKAWMVEWDEATRDQRDAFLLGDSPR
jgi:glycosyltransferase involved in cell wall biosynthesis